MEFGVVGFDGLFASDGGLGSLASDHEAKQKFSGSGFLKQKGSEVASDDGRASKTARNGDSSASTTLLLPNDSLLQVMSAMSDGQQQHNMLSFSCSKPEASFLRNNDGLVDRSLKASTMPYFHPTASSRSNNPGYSAGSSNAGTCFIDGVRGPFTPSQWLELEHQALIYKHIISNEAIPPNLLNPIIKALESAGFSSIAGGPLRPASTWGWGTFHLGYTNSTDPEPGRCRRTDGKKWRCTRDAAADQKYCERHMNRGRHRSRKPVEGQSGHSVSGAATTSITTAATKLMPVGSSSSALVVPGGGAYNKFNAGYHQINNWQLCASKSPAPPLTNRQQAQMTANKEGNGRGLQNATQLSFLSPDMKLNSKENSFSAPKQQILYEELVPKVFGIPSSDSLLNISHKSSSLCSNYASCQDLNDPEAQNSLCHFKDEWPKNHGDRSGFLWPESDGTELSISIPVAPFDFMSPTSPANEKIEVVPLRLSREHDSVEMGLGLGDVRSEPNHRHANWISIPQEISMGGPLGEVLRSTNGCPKDRKNTSSRNLLIWEGSPQVSLTSPTGVLQKAAFSSLSNNSAGSSPRVAENSRNVEAIVIDQKRIKVTKAKGRPQRKRHHTTGHDLSSDRDEKVLVSLAVKSRKVRTFAFRKKSWLQELENGEDIQ
ncbi:hypothetical protein Nepgr_018318 [Nepenthes gracilis]|uniref:Growth-regulating factor n=1 Tax=Nepenthes gracilis TaxID=150966 RepID=A0AAD3SSP8_NEPGR|nr:hypothetical protein Nepgr_018318 [Nepenthes gracilis]